MKTVKYALLLKPAHSVIILTTREFKKLGFLTVAIFFPIFRFRSLKSCHRLPVADDYAGRNLKQKQTTPFITSQYPFGLIGVAMMM